jgi:hypothetical protein
VEQVAKIQNVSNITRSFQPITKDQAIPYPSQSNFNSQSKINSQVVIPRPLLTNNVQPSQTTFVQFNNPQQVRMEERLPNYQPTPSYKVPVAQPPAEPSELSYVNKQAEPSRY